MTTPTERPRDLYRAIDRGVGAVELRADDAGGMPTLALRWAVFDEWTQINSMWEGEFLERIDKRAFSKTIKDDRAGMRVLFQHGRDPQVGDKPLGPIAELKAAGDGAHAEVPLLDTSYNRDLLPGLEAGLYGSSFRFEVRAEKWVDKPDPSEANPRGLPERTILDAIVREFGPVTFPAYSGATAGVRSACRSVTDLFLGAPALTTDLTGRPDAGRVGCGDSREAQRGDAHPSPSPDAELRDREFRLAMRRKIHA